MESNKLDEWFEFEVLPLEAALIRFLRRNRRQEDDVADLLQEVYVRLYESAAKRMPDMVKPFVFATARNLLIDLARRAQVVSIEAYADLDILDVSSDELTPERHATGHQELRLLQQAMDMLPARCREVVQLRKIDDMSQRDVALYMGITEDTVEKQISKGMRVLASSLLVKGVNVGVTKLSLKIRKKDDSI
ncbi:RNA polymerase sigma factor [Undibacterium sp. Ji49W]|uniref:RNA polymerase sigma factor n=1 Tax=Undibacterium sp. Ji49W TaxID=3413040 RepID=UPI003BF19CB3